MQLNLIQAGFFYCTGGAMFGVIPQKIWGKRYPAQGEMCRLSMNVLYVEISGHKILIDAGVGTKYPGRCKGYGFEGISDPAEKLKEIGVEPGDVTDVVLTHLHFDHCGGCTELGPDGQISVTYPNATHWVSRRHWEHSQSPTLLDEDAFWPENIQPVIDAGRVRWVDDEQEIFPGFRLELYGGHTPGQMVPVFELNGLIYCFTGDVLPTSAHISTLWISAYDLFPVDSVDAKIRLLDNAIRENRILITPHDAHISAFTVRKAGDHYKLNEVIAL